MNLEARKIIFIQEFLKFKSEEIIFHFEEFLKIQKSTTINRFTINELNKRIDKSEKDFLNENYKTNNEIKTKYL